MRRKANGRKGQGDKQPEQRIVTSSWGRRTRSRLGVKYCRRSCLERTEKCSPRTSIMVVTADLEKENFGIMQGTKAGSEGVQEKGGGDTGIESNSWFGILFYKEEKWGRGTTKEVGKESADLFSLR